MRCRTSSTAPTAASYFAKQTECAVKSKTMVTYEVQLAIGTPAQPLDVIFDTGSYMLAIFARPPPAGMTPLLK